MTADNEQRVLQDSRIGPGSDRPQQTLWTGKTFSCFRNKRLQTNVLAQEKAKDTPRTCTSENV